MRTPTLLVLLAVLTACSPAAPEPDPTPAAQQTQAQASPQAPTGTTDDSTDGQPTGTTTFDADTCDAAAVLVARRAGLDPAAVDVGPYSGNDNATSMFFKHADAAEQLTAALPDDQTAAATAAFPVALRDRMADLGLSADSTNDEADQAYKGPGGGYNGGTVIPALMAQASDLTAPPDGVVADSTDLSSCDNPLAAHAASNPLDVALQQAGADDITIDIEQANGRLLELLEQSVVPTDDGNVELNPDEPTICNELVTDRPVPNWLPSHTYDGVWIACFADNGALIAGTGTQLIGGLLRHADTISPLPMGEFETVALDGLPEEAVDGHSHASFIQFNDGTFLVAAGDDDTTATMINNAFWQLRNN